MGWLSRLLGEIPEETKYKPSSSFKIKTGKGTVKLETYSEKYKSEDSAKLFAQAYAKKYDLNDEIGSLGKLEKEMENLNKTEKYSSNDESEILRQKLQGFSEQDKEDLTKVMGLITPIITSLFVIIFVIFFLTNSGFGNFPLWIFFLIPFWLFGKKAKKFPKLSK